MDLETFLEELGAPQTGPENRVVAARVDSTNRLARRVVEAYQREEMTPPELLVLALEQVAGRGRQGRSWVSPAGGGVYATRVLTVGTTEELQTVPLLAAVGLARALAPFLPNDRCGLKWPNDLLVGECKIGGVLVESIGGGGGRTVVMIGFGVNYRLDGSFGGSGGTSSETPAPEVPGAPSRRVTWVAREAPEPPTLGRLARALVEGLEAELEHRGDAAYASECFRSLSVHRPGDRISCRVGDEVLAGELVGFDDRGFLRVATETGERLVSAGEIVESDRRQQGGGDP